MILDTGVSKFHVVTVDFNIYTTGGIPAECTSLSSQCIEAGFELEHAIHTRTGHGRENLHQNTQTFFFNFCKTHVFFISQQHAQKKNKQTHTGTYNTQHLSVQIWKIIDLDTKEIKYYTLPFVR